MQLKPPFPHTSTQKRVGSGDKVRELNVVIQGTAKTVLGVKDPISKERGQRDISENGANSEYGQGWTEESLGQSGGKCL